MSRQIQIISTLTPQEIGFPAVLGEKDVLPGIREMKVSGLNAGIWVLADGTDPVSWKNAVRCAVDLGIQTFVFIGRGRALNGMADPVYLVTDHINMSGRNPLIGPNDDQYGVRFPDMTDLYAAELRELFCKKVPETVLLIPQNLSELTELEQKVVDAGSLNICSSDIAPGAIVAQHAGGKSLSLIVTTPKTDLKPILDTIILS